MKEKLHNMPLWLINIVTVVSGIVTIITPIITIILSISKKAHPGVWTISTFVVLLLFLIILYLRMRKYRGLANNRMKKSSYNYHKLLHETRDLFFDTMHSHKLGVLTVNELTISYKAKLAAILDNLCDTINAYTEREVFACIKLISYSADEEIIDKDNATLVTLCRSNNSSTEREEYEKRSNKEIFLKDNTDFVEIVSGESSKNYFYQGNLKKYDEHLKTIGKRYENTNKNWEKYYIGTMVSPIRIEFKKLYHQKKDDAYHIIGFICVDSLSEDAFTEKQEKYNIDLLKSYADIIYVLLGQYRHYMKKLTP